MVHPLLQRIGPQLLVLGAPKAQVFEVCADVSHCQITPDIVPPGVSEDAADDPGFFERRATTKKDVDLLVRDLVVPEEIRALVSVDSCTHRNLNRYSKPVFDIQQMFLYNSLWQAPDDLLPTGVSKTG